MATGEMINPRSNGRENAEIATIVVRGLNLTPVTGATVEVTVKVLDSNSNLKDQFTVKATGVTIE